MVAFVMPISCSNFLCGENSDAVFSSDGEYSSDVEYRMPGVGESIAGLLANEKDLIGITFNNQFVDAYVRTESVTWILKVQCYYGFQPLTAYLSVTYFDRFLYSHKLPNLDGWPLQLLAVACLSLAAKMEETLVPSLLDLQVEGAKFVFESRNVQRMELLVLKVLEWRLGSISPFCYLNFFAIKIDPTQTYTRFLVSRAKEIILSTIQETCILKYRPSRIAAAAMLCAANVLPKFSLVNAHHAQSWCDGFDEETVMNCYQVMQQILFNTQRKQQPKVLPQLRVMSRVSLASSDTISPYAFSSPPSKRIKFNNKPRGDDEKD